MFKTQRLTFSIITQGDDTALFETLNNKHTADIISVFKWPMTMDQVQWWRDRSVEGFKAKSDYMFIGRQDSHPIAYAGIHLDDMDSHGAQIGYWVAHEFQGKGYASESVAGLLGFAHNTLKLEKLYATTAQNNPASERILTKNGFKFSHNKDIDLPNGTKRPSKLFVLKRS